MKNVILVFAILFSLVSCKEEPTPEIVPGPGVSITDEDSVSTQHFKTTDRFGKNCETGKTFPLPHPRLDSVWSKDTSVSENIHVADSVLNSQNYYHGKPGTEDTSSSWMNPGSWLWWLLLLALVLLLLSLLKPLFSKSKDADSNESTSAAAGKDDGKSKNTASNHSNTDRTVSKDDGDPDLPKVLESIEKMVEGNKDADVESKYSNGTNNFKITIKRKNSQTAQPATTDTSSSTDDKKASDAQDASKADDAKE